jgi:RHS repeat-associated protein
LALALALALMMLCIRPAQAQTCTTPVLAWQGHYNIGGNGSGTGNGGWNYTISESAGARVKADGGTVLGSCTHAQWNGVGAFPSGSVSDSGFAACPTGSKAAQATISLSGPVYTSSSLVNIDLSMGKFYFFPEAFARLEINQAHCDGTTTSKGDGHYTIVPANWASAPPTFSLPKTIQTLTGASPPGYTGLWGWGKVTIPWNYSFSIAPVLDTRVDDPCEWIVGSSVGCQDQSLAEDVAITGTGLSLHYESNRSQANPATNHSLVSAVVRANGGWDFNIHHVFDPDSQRLYLGDGGQRSQWQLGQLMTWNGNLLITSKDGNEVYVFDSTTYQHLQTLKPFTGALKYQFAYDSSGHLTTITDANGNVTSIQRGTSGLPVAIVSPYGQTTSLTTDTNGYLNQVTTPGGHMQSFVYTSNGLISSRTDADGNTYSYTYDSTGAVTADSNPAGGSTTFASDGGLSNGLFSHTVNGTTPMQRVRVFGTKRNVAWTEDGTTFSEVRINTLPDGLQTHESKTLQSGQIVETTRLPDGKSTSLTEGPDPRWGIQAPVPVSGDLTMGRVRLNLTTSRTATVGTAGNPFSLTSQTQLQTINGNTYTYSYTGADRTYTETSPVGRTLTSVLDSEERVISSQAPGLGANTFAFDSRGRVSSLAQGTRSTTFTYDSNGNLAGTTDATGTKNLFTYDADGDMLAHTRPDGQAVNYSYDGNGNLTSVTPPSGSTSEFSYNSVGLLAEYTPPAVTGSGPTSYSYNPDQQISNVTRPDGSTMAFSYDSGGRVSSVATGTTTIDYTWGSTTGLLSSSAVAGGETIGYTYDGPLLAELAWTGAVLGSVGHIHDNNLHVISRTIDTAHRVAFRYDGDGMMTGAGALSITRDAGNGLLTGTSLGSTSDSYTYDSFGEVTAYTAAVNGAPVYSVQFTRDNTGRIVAKSETIDGTTTSLTYGYDPDRHLTSVDENGSEISAYTYDADSNRTSVETASGTVAATYDAQDQMLNYGNAIYTYTANGEVATVAAGSTTTSYAYDGMGNLLGVTLPNGTKVTYILDSNGRRMGRSVNGTLTQGFLYDGSRVVAQLTGSNQLVSQFVYATRANSPDFMLKGGATYRIFSDHLGSPRLVVNTATDQVVEHLDYDEFGNVLVDTNPGFQPFGFAGGLYDGTTQLVHFGAREYAAGIGRWLTKDPILFAGGDTNLYAYALGDPINVIDPDGNVSFTVTGYNGVGGGVTVSQSGGNVSVTIEVGIGTPTVGVEVDPDGEAYTGQDMAGRTGDASKITIFGEAGGELSIPVPFLGKVTLIDGKIGVESEESPCPGKREPPDVKGKGCVGPICVGSDGQTHQLEGDPFERNGEAPGEGGGQGGPEAGLGGKAGVKMTIPL